MTNHESEIRCNFGKLNIQEDELSWGQIIEDEELAYREGVCEDCERGWVPKHQGALKTAPLEIVIKEGVVISCDNAFTD